MAQVRLTIDEAALPTVAHGVDALNSALESVPGGRPILSRQKQMIGGQLTVLISFGKAHPVHPPPALVADIVPEPALGGLVVQMLGVAGVVSASVV